MGTQDIKDVLALLHGSKAGGGTEAPFSARPLLSSSSTLFNLACSGSIEGAFPAGEYIYLVGDTDSGKTVLSMSCFAEACRHPYFKKHRLIYDGPEGGALMDRVRLFGAAAAGKIEDRCSATVEDFYDDLEADLCKKKPFIRVLDSMDALDAVAARKKVSQQRRARLAGGEEKGSWGTDKAKINSARVRTILAGLRATGSILIVISQTRDRIGFGSQFDPKTRSGGHALAFYACIEIWSSVGGRLRRTVPGKGKSLGVGILSKCRVKRSRLTGKDRTVVFPIHWSTGIDDLLSCVAYLVEWKHWEGSLKDSTATAPEFDYAGSAEKLVQQVEAQGREAELRALVGQVWQQAEAACAVRRKPRYE